MFDFGNQGRRFIGRCILNRGFGINRVSDSRLAVSRKGGLSVRRGRVGKPKGGRALINHSFRSNFHGKARPGTAQTKAAENAQ